MVKEGSLEEASVEWGLRESEEGPRCKEVGTLYLEEGAACSKALAGEGREGGPGAWNTESEARGLVRGGWGRRQVGQGS